MIRVMSTSDQLAHGTRETTSRAEKKKAVEGGSEVTTVLRFLASVRLPGL